MDATEAAARLADKRGVSLDEVKGTGAGGRVLVSDVEAVIERKRHPWREGRWSGLPQYHCQFCTYETLDAGKIYDHVRREHGALGA